MIRLARDSASLMKALGGHQGVPQVALVLAMLVHEPLEAHHVLPQAIGLPHGFRVVVRRLGEEGRDLVLVEAAHGGAELLLTEVKRRDVHRRLLESALGGRPSNPETASSPGTH
jgi:hypothetical protein